MSPSDVPALEVSPVAKREPAVETLAKILPDLSMPTVPGTSAPASGAARDFELREAGGFDANFMLNAAPGYAPTQAEQAYLARLSECVGTVAALQPPGRAKEEAKEDDKIVERREQARDFAVKALRRRAEAFALAPRGGERDNSASAELYETYRIEGGWREWNRRIDTIPFTVAPVPKPPELCADLAIRIRDVRIPDEKARLKAEIDTALTVTKVVFGERERTVGAWAWLTGRKASKIREVQTRQDEYMTQLAGIAGVGLMNVDPSQAAFAKGDLARYRLEFAAREGGTVKNRYLRRLGLWCAVSAALMAVLYGVAREAPVHGVFHDFRNFFLLAVGASIGTWLSFSLRRSTLAFEDLAVLEEDRLDPGMRVLFMVGLTTVVGLLFWTGAVNFGVGGLQAAEAVQAHGAGALLIGLLAGIAERALGDAVSRRAKDLAASLGGASGPAQGASAPLQAGT